MANPPTYYTRLKPFADYFASGVPILTYHKVGPRPWGARLKGLYASQALFERQLTEFRQAGYETCTLETIGDQADRSARAVVLTFDDGFEKSFRHTLGPLAQYQFRAIQFLVADRLGDYNDWEIAKGEVSERLMDVGQVREWLAAGHDIGAHTCRHPFLTRIDRQEAREEIVGSKKKLEDLFGRAVRHFCYPYGDFDEAIAELVREAGFATACTTSAGLNTRATPSFRLLRFTVRYPSRSFRTVKEWLARRAQRSVVSVMQP